MSLPELAWQQLGEGPDVILIHGLASNRAFWFPNLAATLQHRYRVTLYDLRGHGYSERPASGYRVRDHAEDLLRLMDIAKIERAALIGHSFGGAIALETAGLAPDRCTHLALLDTRVQRIQPQMRLRDIDHLTPYEQEVANRDGGGWDAEPEVGLRFLSAAARQTLAGVQNQARDDFTPFGEGRGAKRAARQWLKLVEETSLSRDFPQAGAPATAYAAIALPTLLLYSQPSRAAATALSLKSALPQARLHWLPGVGHFFPVTHPKLVAQQVEALLAGGH